MYWNWYVAMENMTWITAVLLSVILFALISQAVMLFWRLLSTKQRWYHYLSLILAGVVTIWLSLHLVQMLSYIQGLLNQANLPRSAPASFYRIILERIDQVFPLCVLEISILLALTGALFLLWRQKYSSAKRSPIELHTREYPHMRQLN